MNPVSIVFAVHNHQPIGNFDSVFEEAYVKSYRPFLDVLERHPRVKVTQHWTGTLLEWLVRHHPEFVDRMAAMVQRGQLELLTGSYYEAILAVIPEEDRLGQIQKLTGYIRSLFGVTPRGMWLAERVWEQHLVRSIVRAGVEFVAVDDTHFRHAGLSDEMLRGYYMTEEQGLALRVFPIDKTLRYTIPFRPLEESQRYCERTGEGGGGSVLVHADDGEKFGLWPKTYKHVYTDGWLDSFCSFLENHPRTVQTISFAQAVDEHAPRGTVYLPTASYAEMMKWSLAQPAFHRLEEFEEILQRQGLLEKFGGFVHGGFWRNFLAKYPESNQMHKKMLRISSRAQHVAEKHEVPAIVFDHIWAAQCNDPYWHGVFGGLYLPNLRLPVFRNLLSAESLLDAIERLDHGYIIEETDFDADGAVEVLLESKVMDLYFKPSLGACLVELDYKPCTANLLDILSRRSEGSHMKLIRGTQSEAESEFSPDDLLAKQHGLDQRLHVDWYRHASFVDHFLGPETTFRGFTECQYSELGDFVNQPYRSTIAKGPEHVEIAFTRHGALWSDGYAHKVTVCKTVHYEASEHCFSVRYRIENDEPRPMDVWFGIEMAVGSMAGNAPDRYYTIEEERPQVSTLRSLGEHANVRRWSLTDEWLKVEALFAVSKPATLWRFPLETVSLSEAGFELLYQGSVVFPHWKVHLAPRDDTQRGAFEIVITQSFRHW